MRRKKKNKKTTRRRKSVEVSPLSATKTHLDSKMMGEIIVVDGVKYRRRRKLGSGGSGSVYEIQREDNGITYALKEALLRQNGNIYRGEAERLQSLRNAPHIIDLIAYDFTTNEQMLRMVLELGETDLERELKLQKGKFDEDTIRTFSLEIAKGIKEMHDHSIIHLDMKLANVMFVNGALKIVDLGLSATIPNGVASFSASDYVIRDFMFGSNRPPEQIVPRSDGTYKLTKKVDIWGLGAVVYQMRYGRKPFTDCPENTVSFSTYIYLTLYKFHKFTSLLFFILSYTKMVAVLNPNVRLQHDIGADRAMTEFLEMCTIRDVEKRATIEQLLGHRYLAEAFPLTIADDVTATSPNNQKSESSIRMQLLADTQSKPI
ncbi:kinase domain protein [Dictyocaulus viviparus]|uniref:Kinase domain protein n=1 Tax=Dictyocaulus viviparus TaxID=29172 RepID=A0A0D8Y611_DICVI|nr:kinase domain protein [Dictyocaulus viviparus]